MSDHSDDEKIIRSLLIQGIHHAHIRTHALGVDNASGALKLLKPQGTRARNDPEIVMANTGQLGGVSESTRAFGLPFFALQNRLEIDVRFVLSNF